MKLVISIYSPPGLDVADWHSTSVVCPGPQLPPQYHIEKEKYLRYIVRYDYVQGGGRRAGVSYQLNWPHFHRCASDTDSFS